MNQASFNQNTAKAKRSIASKRFVFDGYEFLPEKQQLLYQGKPCLLEPKMLQLLNLLIEARPKVVSKEALLAELWPDSIVAESSLSRLVSDTRKLMENNGNCQGLIKTVRGRGFCFCAPVDEIIAPSPFQHKDQNQDLTTPLASTKAKQAIVNSSTETKNGSIKIFFLLLSLSLVTYLTYQFASERSLTEEVTTKVIEHNTSQHKLLIMQDIQKHLKLTKTTYLAQKRRRVELKQLLIAKLPEPVELTEEKRMRLHYAHLSADELFIFDQIKAMTQGPMFDGNQAIFLLLEQHPEITLEIPLFDNLYNHLSIWLNKYQRVFNQYEDMAVVFVGDEDGVPFPSSIDALVEKWLAEKLQNRQ